MAKCKYCSKGGWLTQVDEFGLCTNCSNIHEGPIRQCCDVVIESGRIVEKSKNVDTILSRIGVAQERCLQLLEYEKLGIPTLTTPPSEVIRQFEAERFRVVDRCIDDAIFSARQKAQDAATETSKLGGYVRSIDKLYKIMDAVTDVTKLEVAIEKLRREKDGLKARLMCNKAEVQIAKGKHAKALEIYIEAFMVIKQDSTSDSLQRRELAEIAEKIKSLGGTSPEL